MSETITLSDLEKVGFMLMKTRKEKGISVLRASKECYTSRITLTKIERGEYGVSLMNIEKYAEYLGLQLTFQLKLI